MVYTSVYMLCLLVCAILCKVSPTCPALECAVSFAIVPIYQYWNTVFARTAQPAFKVSGTGACNGYGDSNMLS